MAWLRNLWLLVTFILLVKGSIISLMDYNHNYNDQTKRGRLLNTQSKSEVDNYSLTNPHNSTCKANTIPFLISRLLEKKTYPTVASATAEAASGVCLQADNAEEIQSAEAAAAALAAAEAAATAAQATVEAVVTKEEPPTSDEMESESPTQPLDQLNEALIVEGQEKDTERYIVKATPMTASSSSNHNVNVMPTPISQTLEEKKEEIEKQTLEPDADQKAEEVLGNGEGTVEEVTEDVKAAEFNVTADSTTTEKETTETEPSDIVEEVLVVTPAATMNKTIEEPEIPSFSEYTKKALEEEDRKREEERKKKEEMKKNLNTGEAGSKENTTRVHDNTASVEAGVVASWHKKVTKKNFGNLDCGAKVAAANQEAQNALHLITPSKDEYMLNKCTDKAWFVVELCESIKAFKVELANFELFSSSPKDIRISMSNVFPGRDKDWILYGQFEANEDRTVQSFISNEGVFGKFVKVEVLSHYGNEHYCIVSLFKIFGISDFELIGMGDDDDDDDDDDDFPQTPQTPPPSSTTESPILEPMSSLNTMSKDGLFNRGVFPPRKQVQRGGLDMAAALNQTSLVGNTFAYNMSCPECDDDCFRDVYFLLSNDYVQLLKDFQASIGLRSALTGQVCRSYGFHSMDQVPMPSYAGLRLVEFYATLFGANRIMALCNVMEIQAGHGLRADQHLVMPPPGSTPLVNGLKPNTDGDVGTKIDPDSPDKAKLIVDTPTNSLANGDQAVRGDDTIKAEVSSPQDTKDKVAPTKVKNPDESKISAEAIPGDSGPVKIDPTPASDQGGPAKPIAQPSASKDKVAPDGSAKDKADTEAPPPAPASKVNNGASSGGGSDSIAIGGTKGESVWQKLSHKIKALERNVSLSGGYLEQLSVQYKKQIEDLQLAVRQSGEALAAASQARELDRTQMSELQEQIGQLKVVVEEVSTRMETMGNWDVVVHSLVLVVEIFIGILLVCSCFNRRVGVPVDTTSGGAAAAVSGSADQNIENSSDVNENSSSAAVVSYQRRHSHEEKSTILDRPHIEEINQLQRRSSLDLSPKRNSPQLANNLDNKKLSKGQKKRMNRRLSRANAQQDSSPVKVEQTNLNISTTNMFEILNNSPNANKPVNPRALSNNSNRKTLLNGHSTVSGNGNTNESSRSATPDENGLASTNGTATSTPSHTSRLKAVAKSNGNKIKRSKSTSPSRKVDSYSAKQNNIYNKIQQKTNGQDWMHPSSTKKK